MENEGAARGAENHALCAYRDSQHSVVGVGVHCAPLRDR